MFRFYVDILYLWTSLEVPRNPAFKYVQSRLIWRHIGPNQYGAVGIGKIQIIKWQCSSENYLHSNVLMRFRQVAIARQVEIVMQS